MIPDLVVEAASSGDRPGKIQQEAHMWLDAGARMAWVVAPVERAVESRES